MNVEFQFFSSSCNLRMLTMDAFLPGFEEDDDLRSTFIRGLTLRQSAGSTFSGASVPRHMAAIPMTLVRYWHDSSDLPADVRACLNTWERLRHEGVDFRMFDDASAAAYIQAEFGARERQAFAQCRHPAMRSDYLRLCFVLTEGGLYVDADDELLDGDWRSMFQGGGLKAQPLCYDVPSGQMVPPSEIWRVDARTSGRIFYLNNNPIAAPAGHPVLRRALSRATERLLRGDPTPEIQSTTGPGNFTAALAAHARSLLLGDGQLDFELLKNWDAIARTKWDLSYRADARNWRNMDV